MNNKLYKIFFKSLPLLMSCIIGLLIFFIVDIIVFKESISFLMRNLGAILLSVPVVFVCYQIAYEISLERLKGILFKKARVQIDSYCSALAVIIIKKFKLEEFDTDVFERKKIKAYLKPYKEFDLKHLDSIRKGLNNLLRNRDVNTVLDSVQLHNIYEINSNLSFLIKELKGEKDKVLIEKKLENIVQLLCKWISYSKEELLYIK